MFKYKNTTKGILKFRAADSNGIKKVFELKPDKEMESDREVKLGGLELVKEKAKTKKKSLGGD